MNGWTRMVYGYVFSLLFLGKYVGKWSHTWREFDGFGER